MNILFFGDVVGKIGRKALLENLPILKKKYNADFVIVNAENITHGKGIIKKHYNFLRNIGVDAITLGNHYLNRISLNEFINEATSLIRPVNLIDYKLGLGSKVFKVNGIIVNGSSGGGAFRFAAFIGQGRYARCDRQDGQAARIVAKHGFGGNNAGNRGGLVVAARSEAPCTSQGECGYN